MSVFSLSIYQGWLAKFFSVDIGFLMGSALVLIARNFVSLGGVVFTCE